VSLPESWVYANTSVPSDHLTNTWSDPSDANVGLTVVVSGCQGCVVATPGSATPDPRLAMPSGATVTRTVSPGQIFYSHAATTAGYTDFGMVLVTNNGTTTTGFVRLDLVVPSGQSDAANTVLTSFSINS
jgi:hypothetical protein